MNLYKWQLCQSGETRFVDASDWMPGLGCLERMRSMTQLQGEMRVIDQRGRLVASTLDSRGGVESAMALSRNAP